MVLSLLTCFDAQEYGLHAYKTMMAGRNFNATATTLVAMDGPLLTESLIASTVEKQIESAGRGTPPARALRYAKLLVRL